MTHPRSITVAAGQIAARLMNEADATLASLDNAIAGAHEQGADLLVLPECAYPAYLLGSVASYLAGGHMSGDAFVQWLAERAARCRMHIVSGFVDNRHDMLCNAAVLIDDHGREIGRAHKRFLWHLDHDWYAPGTEIRAFDSRLGRIGLVICAETRSPELLATLAADGATLLAMPTCWINGSFTAGKFTNPQIDFLIEARAREFGLPFVCADKSGVELAGVGYVGKSRIVQSDGSLAAEAPPTGEALITARIRLSPSTWQPHATPEAIDRLLSDSPPVRPAVADMPTLNAAAIPGTVSPQVLESDGPLLHHLRGHNLDLLIAQPAGNNDSQRMKELAGKLGIRLLTPTTCCEVVNIEHLRVGCVTGPAASCFVTPRAMVLDGAAMLVFSGPPTELPILRARALENRVFVAAVNDRFSVIIGPDGSILSYASSSTPIPPIAILRLQQSADKLVAPGTDLFDERRPSLLRLGPVA
jgi:predicted amidohydrolase